MLGEGYYVIVNVICHYKTIDEVASIPWNLNGKEGEMVFVKNLMMIEERMS